jgi:saccharopine dehydrogenase (NAD+, L-lysine-forming)
VCLTVKVVSPETAKSLIQAGYPVRVERSSDRIYNDDEFEAVGAKLIPTGSWREAPQEDIILGLKELSDDDNHLPHTYIHFQHIFKKQHGWAPSLSRFARSGGTLYDLEFLTDESGRRVAAFGYWAGYAGTAVALLSWAHQVLHPGVPQGQVPVFDSAPDLIQHVKSTIEPAIRANGNQLPRVMVIGALGRCGKGAVDFCLAAGLDQELIQKWDMAETAPGGPFAEIAASDIFINCVYLGPTPSPPFITFDSLSSPERRLRVICDVSCDPNSENNPIPVYSDCTSFDKPTTPISKDIEGPELKVIAIDHLPALIARESSDEYSSLLLPNLLSLNNREREGVWKRAEQTYKDRVSDLA